VSAVSGGLLRDVGLIAGFDLRESLRTRRALVLVLLYVLIAASASGIYIRIMAEIQDNIAAIPEVAADPDAAMAMGMVQDSGYRMLLLFFAGGDAPLADHLATYPPMVLVFAWISLAFLPWFIALTSYDLIAGDLHLRTIRYAALRTSRGAYVIGKLLGQAALVAGVTGLGMLPVLVLGALYLPGFNFIGTLLALLSTWPVTVLCALGYLGVVTLASQLCKGPGAARATAVGLLFAVWIFSLLPAPYTPLGWLSPWYWKYGLFHPGVGERMLAIGACLGLCAGYTALGYLRFRRRDL
jgi:ABC-type transport system involved in multi-copper enzyme maturation permease subunit